MDNWIMFGVGFFLGTPFGFFLLALMMVAGGDKREDE